MSATVSLRLKAVTLMTRVACQLRRFAMERVAGKADDAEGSGNPSLASCSDQSRAEPCESASTGITHQQVEGDGGESVKRGHFAARSMKQERSRR
jgi:hypothetical protein